LELRDFLRILRAHWIGLVVFVVLGTALAYGYALLQPRVYTANATGYVTIASPSGADAGTALVSTQAAQQQVTSFVNIGTWRSVAQYAIDALHLDTSPQALAGQVSVTNPTGTVFVTVSANASSPVAARDLAEAWVRGMRKQIIALETGTAADATADGAATSGAAASGDTATGDAAASGDAATGNSADVKPAVDLVPGDSAALPTAPSSPNVKRYVGIGALAGLVLGIAYVLIRHVLDRRVRDPREIERQTGATVVGWIPQQKGLGTDRTFFDLDGASSSGSFTPAVEALRELRTNLQYMNIDDPPRIIVVTSPLPGDGKSVTAANLARSLAAAGQHTVLIDADLRRPVVASEFGFADAPGLTDLLAGRAAIGDVAHVADKGGNLMVFTAGRIPPNPSEVLGSKRMRELLADLRKEAIVILDSPPTLPVTDAAVLSASADGVLMVVSAGHTTYDMLQRSLANIERANGRSLGVVLNKVPRRGTDAGYYGYYGYAGGYAGEAPASTADPVDAR